MNQKMWKYVNSVIAELEDCIEASEWSNLTDHTEYGLGHRAGTIDGYRNELIRWTHFRDMFCEHKYRKDIDIAGSDERVTVCLDCGQEIT